MAIVQVSAAETEEVFRVAELLTGSCQSGRYRRDILVNNVMRRVHATGKKSVKDYLEFAQSDGLERKELLSALTIHTTSWFRENPHYVALEAHARNFAEKKNGIVYRLWSVAASTGEELYSAGIVLESVRKLYPTFDYELVGTDIDPISLRTGASAIFSQNVYDSIPTRFREFTLIGSGKTKGLFTISKDIRDRAKFYENNLASSRWVAENSRFDWVMCRNVLIYFSEKDSNAIVHRLSELVTVGGILCLGHSENLVQTIPLFDVLGNSCFQKQDPQQKNEERKASAKSVKVLIVDDSASIRKLLTKLLQKASFHVVEASSAMEASVRIRETEFDLVTLDLNMPGEDGPSWLKRERAAGFKVPVVIVTDADANEAEKVMGALESGAQDYVIKSMLNQNPTELTGRISGILKLNGTTVSGSTTNVKKTSVRDLKTFYPEAILVGASTGGPEALWRLLRNFSTAKCPPIVVVQHINSTFAHSFASRLEKLSGLKLAEPIDGEVLQQGHLYLAWSSTHLGVKRIGEKLHLSLSDSEKLHGHRPAVDFLFKSAAKVKARTLNVLLTGMGRDGAAGMKELYDTGVAINIVQDEETSVVYGMPKEAVALGAVHFEGSLTELRELMDRSLASSERKAA